MMSTDNPDKTFAQELYEATVKVNEEKMRRAEEAKARLIEEYVPICVSDMLDIAKIRAANGDYSYPYYLSFITDKNQTINNSVATEILSKALAIVVKDYGFTHVKGTYNSCAVLISWHPKDKK